MLGPICVLSVYAGAMTLVRLKSLERRVTSIQKPSLKGLISFALCLVLRQTSNFDADDTDEDEILAESFQLTSFLFEKARLADV